jgi:hypothetical protein
MKSFLALVALLATTTAHADELILSCKYYRPSKVGIESEARTMSFRFAENGTKVQYGGRPELLKVTTTDLSYSWTWTTSGGGSSMFYREVVDRVTGEYVVYDDQNNLIMKGTCHKAQPKF